MSYTDNGMLATLTDAENNKTTYEYDGFDRLTRTLFPMPTKGANQSNPNDDELLAYDAASNVTGFTSRANPTIGFTYDALNRTTLKNMPATSAGDVSYTYDLLGRLLTAKFGSGRGITNSFNSVGEMSSTATDMSGTARTLSYQYDAAGRRTRVTHPDGHFFTYQYDTLDRVTGILEGASTNLVMISYDDLGRRTSLSRPGAGTTSYTYDPVSRLASLNQNLAGSSNDLIIDLIAYNPASQIVGQRRAPDAYAWTGHTNGTIPTTSNGLNQIATKDATAYTYDANGNLTGDGTWTYTYDTENRLKTAQSAASGVNLFYDPLGRLWQVSGDPVLDTQFVNDGIDLALEYRISSGAVERRYVHGPGWDEPLIQYDGTSLATRRQLHADERGSIVALTDAAGANPAINRYDEFGVPQSTNSGRFGYTGQAWLKEIGLNYYKARMYRPADGVFLQPDPIGYVGGMNFYAYVGNDPINFVDPLGLDDDEIVVTPEVIVIGTRCTGTWIGGVCFTGGINFLSRVETSFASAIGGAGGTVLRTNGLPISIPSPLRQCPATAETMDEATDTALQSTGQPGETSPLTSEFSQYGGGVNFTHGDWRPVQSIHAKQAFEHDIAGGYVVKIYIGDENFGGRNTATITSPTDTWRHSLNAAFWTITGFPTNMSHASGFLATQGGC